MPWRSRGFGKARISCGTHDIDRRLRIVIACPRGPFYKRGMCRLQRRVAIASICLFLISPASSRGAENDASPPIVLKAARLFDGKSKALLANGVVIVQGST